MLYWNQLFSSIKDDCLHRYSVGKICLQMSRFLSFVRGFHDTHWTNKQLDKQNTHWPKIERAKCATSGLYIWLKNLLHSDREVKRNKTYETIIGKRIEPLSANQNFVTVIAILLKYLILTTRNDTRDFMWTLNRYNKLKQKFLRYFNMISKDFRTNTAKQMSFSGPTTILFQTVSAKARFPA